MSSSEAKDNKREQHVYTIFIWSVTFHVFIIMMSSRFDNKTIDNTRINQVSTVFKNESKEPNLLQRDAAHIIFDLIMSSPGS